MSLAFNPDDGPPRLLRFVGEGSVPTTDTLAVFDRANNLLIINRELYDTLDPMQQHITQRSTTSLIMERWY